MLEVDSHTSNRREVFVSFRLEHLNIVYQIECLYAYTVFDMLIPYSIVTKEFQQTKIPWVTFSSISVLLLIKNVCDKCGISCSELLSNAF